MILSNRYDGRQLRCEDVARFFPRAREHAACAPRWIAVEVDEAVRRGTQGETLLGMLRELTGTEAADWLAVLDGLLPHRRRPQPAERPDDPACGALGRLR